MTNFKSAMDWMDDNFPYLVTSIANLGRPVFRTNTPTLQVVRDNKTHDIVLQINEDYLSDKTDAQGAGLLMHEFYHPLLNHFDEMSSGEYENQQALMIAQECIINDSVLQEGADLPDGLYFGEDYVGYDCAFLPTRIVYDDIMKNNPPPDDTDMTICICGGGEGSGDESEDESGTSKPTSGEIIAKMFKDVDLSEASENLKESLTDTVKKAGTGFDIRKLLGSDKVSLAWPKLINIIHPNTFTDDSKGKHKSTWARQRRNLSGMKKRVMLPSKMPSDRAGIGRGKKKTLVMALDFSGSVSSEKLDELLSLATSIPKDKLDVKCCTFSTQYVPFDIDKGTSQRVASGGTSFEAVSDFVKSLKLSQDPKVLVLTDGYANFYNKPKDLDTNWHWLIFDNPDNTVYDSRVTNNVYPYDDYIK